MIKGKRKSKQLKLEPIGNEHGFWQVGNTIDEIIDEVEGKLPFFKTRDLIHDASEKGNNGVFWWRREGSRVWKYVRDPNGYVLSTATT